jgi:hypothetical protein
VNLPGTTFIGGALEDAAALDVLPDSLAEVLSERNGIVAFEGGLHVRGICDSPTWHSLDRVWMRDRAFHVLYQDVEERDVPFAQDAVGDQWLLRDEQVIHLATETGEIDPLGQTLSEFFEAARADPLAVLGLHPLLQFQQDGGTLLPGQLLSVWPPFCAVEAAEGVSLAAVPTEERLGFLAEFSRQLPPDGNVRVTLT